MLRARSLLSHVLMCIWIGSRWVDRVYPVHGTPCFSFYRPRKSMGYSGGKEKKREREKKAFRIAGSFFSFIQAPPIL